ncbi:efflux RND transporter periplasmic adaptor subunit [Planctomycetaceae bacterium SH139]
MKWISRFRSRTSWAAVIAVTSTLLAAGVWHVHRSLAALPPLRTVPIKRGDLRMFIAATGTIEPKSVVEVGALVSGKLIAFGDGNSRHAVDQSSQSPIPVGTRVNQGGILAQIDPQLYEIELQQARVAHRLALAEAARLQTRLDQSSRELERAERLRSTNSESQYDRIATEFAIAQADLQMAKARTEQTASHIQYAEINLARTTIRSPIDGVVIDHRVNLGQQAGPTSPGMFLISADLKQMRVRTSVSETDIGKVFPGQPVVFTVDGYRDSTLTGSVEQVLMNARIQGNFVTYDVLVKIDSHAVNLLPHMTADVQLETVNLTNVWLVPSESLDWQPDSTRQAAAFRIDGKALHLDAEHDSKRSARIYVATENGQVRAIPVDVGVDDGTKTAVSAEGLQEALPVVVGTIRETTLARIIPSVKTLR